MWVWLWLRKEATWQSFSTVHGSGRLWHLSTGVCIRHEWCPATEQQCT